MITPVHIDHLVLRVVDLDAMLGFYRDALGCTVERRRDDIGLVQLRAGRALIDLVPVDGALGRAGGAPPGAGGRNLDHFCLRVAPFDEARIRAALAAHGIAAGETATRYGAEGEGPSIYVTDPEGNVVELKGAPATAPGFATARLPSAVTEHAPDGSAVRVLARRSGGSMAHFALPAGVVSRAVKHRSVDEIWYVLGGAGEMWRREDDREEVVALEAGVCLTIPAGTCFQFRATGDEGVCAVAVTMPPWPGDEEAVAVPGPWPASAG